MSNKLIYCYLKGNNPCFEQMRDLYIASQLTKIWIYHFCGHENLDDFSNIFDKSEQSLRRFLKVFEVFVFH